jgi:hypothetical protein
MPPSFETMDVGLSYSVVWIHLGDGQNHGEIGFEKRRGTAGGSPLRSLCGGLAEAIGKQATARQNYQAAHILSIKNDVRFSPNTFVTGL